MGLDRARPKFDMFRPFSTQTNVLDHARTRQFILTLLDQIWTYFDFQIKMSCSNLNVLIYAFRVTFYDTFFHNEMIRVICNYKVL